jgi:hypothetical protein
VGSGDEKTIVEVLTGQTDHNYGYLLGREHIDGINEKQFTLSGHPGNLIVGKLVYVILNRSMGSIWNRER